MIAAASTFVTLDMEQFYDQQININLWYSLLLMAVCKVEILCTVYVIERLQKMN